MAELDPGRGLKARANNNRPAPCPDFRDWSGTLLSKKDKKKK
jgi:hypothetical protein